MSKNPLSSLSYTNKDFTSIYVELLDIVKELSSKWDPTISNESDPGVILLKADAIIADKANYNIDKNILELYPETVTQELNARNTYKQLGYTMPWYKSATTELTFKWVGRELVPGESATIKKYTMVTNETEDVVYTLLKDVTMDLDHLVVAVPAIEGIFNTLTINGSTTIDIVNLDDNNRIYLPDYSVAENGVFVTNVGSSNQWTQVDNLQTTALSTRCYEFGVDSRNSICYLEFPQDIDTLIGSGLEIRYVASQGESGNMAAATVDRFYSEQSITVGSDSFVLNEEIVVLTNASASTNGSDPESLQQAYRSYRKTAGTFRTLVTLRDYINSIYNSGLVSNVIVSDRLNDIQSTYTIKTEDKVNPFVTQVHKSDKRVVSYFADAPKQAEGAGWFEYIDNAMVSYTPTEEDVAAKRRLYRKSEDNNAEMSAFDLKLYLLHTPGIISSIDDYESTFDLEAPDSNLELEVKGYLQEQQCVQHDFMPLIEDLPCLYKNSYPIKARIVPQHYLTDVQIQEVKRNIVTALWRVCNSRSVEFGEEPKYDVIYDAIQNSDERIKVVILDEFQYTTFATYWDAENNEFKDVPISKTESELVVSVTTQADLMYHKKHMKSARLHSAYFIVGTETLSYYPTGSSDDLENYTEFHEGDIVKYNSDKDDFELYSDKAVSFQKDIIVKSILAGRTPLYDVDGAFEPKINQMYERNITTGKVTTALILAPFSDTSLHTRTVDINDDGVEEPIIWPDETYALSAEYKLKSNETLRLFAPSLETETTYSNYVKFELELSEPTGTEKSPVVWDASIPSDGADDKGWHFVHASEYNEQLYKAISPSLFNIVVEENGKDIIHNYKDYLDKGTVNCKIRTNGGEELLRVNADGYAVSVPVTETLEGGGATWGVKIDSSSDQDETSNESFVSLSISCGSEAIYLRPDAEGNLRVLPNEGAFTFDCKLVQLPQTVHHMADTENNRSYTLSPHNSESSILTIVNNGARKLKQVRCDSTYWFSPTAIEEKFSSELSVIDDVWLKYRYIGKDNLAEFVNEKVIISNAWSSGNMSLYEEKALYTIPANTDYQLHENESITFFWRTEDTEDAPYKYVKYTGLSSAQATSVKQSPIIRPTFTVNGVAVGDALIDPKSLNSEGELAYGSKHYSTVYKLYGDNDLSGSKTIEIRKMNQAVLTPDKNNCYFITNKVVKQTDEKDKVRKDYYVLTLKPFQETLSTSSFRYILQSDEYFINMNKSGTEYEILGPGTLIGIETKEQSSEPYKISVPAVSYQEVTKQGIKAIADNYWEIPTGCTMYCREQQMYNIVENDTLILRVPESYGTRSRPVFTSWQDTRIPHDFEISYKPASGEVVTLPRVKIQSDDYSWCARACLNLNVSREEPQVIEGISKDTEGNYDYKSIQMLLLKSEENSSEYVMYPKFNMQPYSATPERLYLQSDVNLNKVGGTNIDISYVNLLGERKDVDLYLYSENDAFTEDPFSINDDGYIVCDLEDVTEGSPAYADIKLDPEGKYMMSLDNRSDQVLLRVSWVNENGSAEVLKCLNSTEEYNGQGRFYYMLPKSEGSLYFEHKYRASADPQPKLGTFIIDSLFKYTDNELFEDYGLSSESILARIQELDVDGVFKYNNIVTKDDEIYIKDPLDGKSFFNTNHVMNQFTIGKAEVRMSDATDSYILPVNNR